MASFKDIINLYLQGAVEGQSSGQGNLKIKGNILIHYRTPILERYDGKFILNMTRYSLVTGRLQKQIKEMISEDRIVIVKGITEGYKGSLRECIMGEQKA